MATPLPTATARAEQHIRMLAELADLTMVLCRVAALRACEQLDREPGETPAPQPGPNPEPAAPALQSPAVHSPAVRSPAVRSPAVRAPADPDAVLAFARLSRALRQTIALEARIAANRDAPRLAAGRAAAARDAGITWRATPALPHEIAKAHLAEAVLAAAAADAAADADAAATRRHGHAPENLLRRIDERLDADDVAEAIDDDDELATIVATICQDLGIAFDPDEAPDHLLFPIHAAIEFRQNAGGRGKPLRYRLDPRAPGHSDEDHSDEDESDEDDSDEDDSEEDDPPEPSRPRRLDA